MVAPLRRLYRGPGIKPYASVPRIDWSHPLAAGLDHFIYDAGSAHVDLAAGLLSSAVTNTTSPAIATNKLGPGLKYTGTAGANGWSVLGKNGHPDYTNFGTTIPYSVVAGTILGTTGNSVPLAAVAMTTATDSTYNTGPALFYDNGGSVNRFAWILGNGASQVNYTATAVANVLNTWGLIGTASTTATRYANGIFEANSTGLSAVNSGVVTAGKIGAFTINNGTPVGNNDSGGLGGQNGSLPFYAAWNRALTASEFLQIHLDPYCFLIFPEDEMLAERVGAAAAGATPSLSWQNPLSPAPLIVRAAQSFSFVPFNTVQPSNTRNRLEWQQPLASAPNPPTTWPGFSFEPFNTPQVSASTPAGWQPQLSSAPKPVNVWYNQPQLVVPPPFVVALGWLQPFSAAPPIGRVPTSVAYVPFNTVQTQPVTLTYGWLSALSNAPPIVRTPAGFAFVPFDTPQVVAQIASYGWLSALSTAPTAAKAPSSYSYTPIGPVPQTVTFAWQQPLYVAPPRPTAAIPALDLVPAWAAATTPVISLAWLQPLATASPRPPSFQPGTFVPLYTVQVPLAGIVGMAWFYPLSVAPSVTYSPRGPYSGWAPSPLSTVPPPTPGPLPHNLHFHVTFGKLKSF